MRKRLVIIGCGKIAHRHAGQANRIGLLVGACDPDKTVLDQFIEKYTIRGYTAVESLFHNCQAEGLAAVNLITSIYALLQEPVIRQNHG